MSLDDCKVIELPTIVDPRGSLTFLEGSKHIPFDIKRVFYMYNLPAGGVRGSHSHKTLQQFLICLSGGFDISLDDGHEKKIVHLNRPWIGLHIPPMVWSTEINFQPGSVCLVMASESYDEADYIRDYDEFKLMLGAP